MILITFYLAACGGETDYSDGFHEEHNLKPAVSSQGQHDFKLISKGLYGFEITTTNPPPNPIDPEAYSFSLSYQVTQGDEVIRSGQLTNLGSPWWSGDGTSGFILEWLDIPDELPENTPLKIGYIVNSDERFISFFGEMVVVGIWKLSDK